MLSQLQKQLLNQALIETAILLVVTAVFVSVFGLIFGYLLYVTEPNGILNNKKYKIIIHRILGIIIDTFRSIPFIILILILIPLTLLLVNTMIGPKAALPALILSATPFYSRIVYNAFKEVPKGNLEALVSLGAKPLTIFHYMIKEALPGLISGLTVALVSLVGFIASAGVIGTGGLGKLAIERFRANDNVLMFVCVILLLVLVFIIQFTGDFISKKVDKR